MEIDLLPAELQSLAATSEADRLHTEYAVVENAGGLDILDGEHQVVELRDVHGNPVGLPSNVLVIP